MQLITLPFAGGNRYSLGFIGELLPQTIQFTPLELPGRGVRMYEPLLSGAQELAEDVFLQLQQVCEENYILLGDCIGALLSFLVARKLVHEKKALPSRLIISGCPAPVLFKERRTTMLQEKEMKERLIQFGTDPALLRHKGFYEMIEPIMRSDLVAFNGYIYKEEPPLPLPVTVLTDNNTIAGNEILSWQYETIFPLQIVELPGALKDSVTGLSQLFQQIAGLTLAG